ncbi:MAG TPA: permease [Firmicutes bacterium]|nr:permease [Bacillota bacterium]
MSYPSYRNFNAAIYCSVGNLLDIQDLHEFEKKFSLLEKHIQIGKVYLETYRGGRMISREQMLCLKNFFESRGIHTAGGITTDSFGTGEGGFSTFCYTSPESLSKLQEIIEFTAGLFDEIILDDFFFTSCRCASCLQEKGDKSWAAFRTGLMKKVSEEIIVGPAKKVNPNVHMVIKYPNWYEHYQETGYNTQDQPGIFDSIYTGTETRNPLYAQQHLPKYLGYFLMRYLENIAPERNGGGWFDPYECGYNLTSYAEQAYLTLFAKAKEATLFCLGSLMDPEFSLCPPLAGQVFADMDQYLDQLGTPTGTACYLPHHSKGEDYLHAYIGMLGIPLEPYAEYPAQARQIFLTKGASCDADILSKIRNSLSSGADVIVTSGFAEAMQDHGFRDLAEVTVTGRKAKGNHYGYSNNGGTGFSGYAESASEVEIPQIDFPTNDVWQIAGIFGEDNSFPLLLKTSYGKGRLFILTVPEDYGQFYHYPRVILQKIREAFHRQAEIRLDAVAKTALFTYDNHTLILHSFQPFYDEAVIRVAGENRILYNLVNGRELKGIQENGETVFKITLSPGFNRVFQIRNAE